MPNPNVEVELNEIDLEECLGRGGHGAVYKVRLCSIPCTLHIEHELHTVNEGKGASCESGLFQDLPREGCYISC